MASTFPGFSVERDSAGNITRLGEVSSPSLYLDTADLSYLILRRIGRETDRAEQWRTRLAALLHANRLRLRLSFVHLAELALRPELLEPALHDLERTPNIWIVTTGPSEVFGEEMRRTGPPALIERRASAGELRGLRLPLRFWSRGIPGTVVARLMKRLIQLKTVGDSQSKAAALREREQDLARLARAISGDLAALPGWMRPVFSAYLWMVEQVAERLGLPANLLRRLAKAGPAGLGWAVTVAGTEGRLPRRDGRKWNAEDAKTMPATTLRACVERVQADPRRPADARTPYDVDHLAYVAYSDFSTIDGPNFDAIKSVRAFLPHLRIFRTGNLDPVLDALEAESQ